MMTELTLEGVGDVYTGDSTAHDFGLVPRWHTSDVCR